MGPFEVSANDIQQLDDGQLRELLRLLLEAEARSRGISLACVFVGGDQNAADGGVDGRVEWKDNPAPEGWFPCRKTLFQSKAENMRPSDLSNELAPKKIVRPFFKDLVRSNGAYIVFSTENCSEGMYKRRLDAMRAAVKSVRGSKKITFDFYDASRIARWSNTFPGVANQVRTFVGKPMAGWQSFGNWSAPEIEDTPDYILDDCPKLTIGGGEPIAITQAISEVRTSLTKPQAIMRLVGLSGVGKTRLAQTLFDDRISLDYSPRPWEWGSGHGVIR